MTKHIILTGAMGSGKSTVLSLLKQKGYRTIEEPARPILAEQRSIEDEGVPEKIRSFSHNYCYRVRCINMS
jgi:predicted ATPase